MPLREAGELGRQLSPRARPGGAIGIVMFLVDVYDETRRLLRPEASGATILTVVKELDQD